VIGTQAPGARANLGLDSLFHRELLLDWGVHVRRSGLSRQERGSSDTHEVGDPSFNGTVWKSGLSD